MTTAPNQQAAYGDQMAKYFRVGKGPNLVIRPPSEAQIAITRLASDAGLPERTASIPSERALVVSVHLTPASERGCEIWVDDRYSRIAEWPAGGVGIYDLESNPRVRNRGLVDWVHYHVPRSTLNAFANDAEIGDISALQCPPGVVDPVLHQMTRMILPSLNKAHALEELFLDYFRLLFCAHVAGKYAPSFTKIKNYRGGLAPWQRRRATELLREHIDGSVKLSVLAGECGLSVSHFARSFRQSFATSAHHYLILLRVERAKSLLTNSILPLSEVAFQSGFSDQAAFSRTFKAVVGAPPGQWRREENHRRPEDVGDNRAELKRCASFLSTCSLQRSYGVA
jgi:AraC-like DNA-binding protein